MIPAIFLMGPTASGKTELAIRLAELLPVSLVSVDSLLVYRHFNIGGAKPPPGVLSRYPHELIDIREPDDPYSAGNFRKDARALVDTARAAGKIPLLVGGTGLYFRALERGIADFPPAAEELRLRIAREGESLGWPALHARLGILDPGRASRIHPQDRQRILRALELNGLGVSPAEKHWCEDFPGPVWKIALCLPRKRLHARIAQRFRQMLSEGFPDEVQALHARYGDADFPAMRAVGYRQLFAWARGSTGLEQAGEEALAATRQLAKRQETWLRAETLDWRIDPEADGAFQALWSWLRVRLQETCPEKSFPDEK